MWTVTLLHIWKLSIVEMLILVIYIEQWPLAGHLISWTMLLVCSNTVINLFSCLVYIFILDSLFSGLPWIICLAAGVSSAAQGPRGTNVCIPQLIYFSIQLQFIKWTRQYFSLTGGRVQSWKRETGFSWSWFGYILWWF